MEGGAKQESSLSWRPASVWLPLGHCGAQIAPELGPIFSEGAGLCPSTLCCQGPLGWVGEATQGCRVGWSRRSGAVCSVGAAAGHSSYWMGALAGKGRLDGAARGIHCTKRVSGHDLMHRVGEMLGRAVAGHDRKLLRTFTQIHSHLTRMKVLPFWKCRR